MQIDPEQLQRRERYQWMTHSVGPRPIAFVSTISSAGILNLAPFSYFNAVCSTPPILSIGIGSKRGGVAKDTWANIRDTGELVVNVVSASYAEKMVATAADWPADTSEFEACGFTPAPSEDVAPPRVAESPIAMECVLHQAVPVGDVTLVLARIRRFHVDPRVLTDGLPDPVKWQPLGRLGGDGYAPFGELLKLARG